MFTGSVTENRVTVGIPPPIRQNLHDEAKRLGVRMSEVIRSALADWNRLYEQTQEDRRTRR